MTRKQLIIVGSIFVSVCLLVGCSVLLWNIYQANNYRDFSPELVVNIFSDAGYDVSELHSVDEYPGPLSDETVESGGKFDVTLADSTSVEMYIVSYHNQLDAASVTREINNLNRRMNGKFSYAYRRGVIVLSINTVDPNIAGDLGKIFMESLVFSSSNQSE